MGTGAVLSWPKWARILAITLASVMAARTLAEYFAVSPRTIGRWRQQGLIPFVVTPGGTFRYQLAAVEAVLLALQPD